MEESAPPEPPTMSGQSNQPPVSAGSSQAGDLSEPSDIHTPLPTKLARRHPLAGLRALGSIAVFILCIIITAALINQFVFQSYYVDGTSMTPTLQNSDRLIIDKVERSVAGIGGHPYIPKRGQIVVLDSSLVDQYGRDEQLIKRVIGLPGEIISISSDGVVVIKNKDHPNGFDANKALGLRLQPTYVDTPVNLVIPDNSVFVMGDNRGPGGSFDSRSFGPVNTSKIQGRLWARIFPFNRTGFF